MNNTKRSSSSFPQIKIPFPPIINLAELLQPNKSFSLFDEPHKPSRAPNAFIIYRKVFVKVARDEGHNLPMTAISSMASISWEKEPEEVKAEYKRISKEAHLKKKAMFPKDKRKKRKETWNVVSFQGPNLLKHYEVNHDDDEELDEDSNDISVIVNSDTNTTTTIYNNNYNSKRKNNKNKICNNTDNINNNDNRDGNNNNNNMENNIISNNYNYYNYNNNIYNNNNMDSPQFGISAPIYSPETVDFNFQDYNNNSNENEDIFNSDFLNIQNGDNFNDLLNSFFYNQHQQNYQQQQNGNNNQLQQDQQMTFSMLLQEPITTAEQHLFENNNNDNNGAKYLQQYLHHTPDLSSDESISSISSPSLSLHDTETVASNNNTLENIFNIYSNNNNDNNNDNLFFNLISSDNDINNNKVFDSYHYEI